MWQAQSDIKIPAPLVAGLDDLKKLVRILGDYPYLGYIPIFENSIPEITGIVYNNEPRNAYDIYRESYMAQMFFAGGCEVNIFLGFLAEDGGSGSWHLADVILEWSDPILVGPDGKQFYFMLDADQINALFLMDHLRQMARGGEPIGSNVVAALEYYRMKAAVIAEYAARQLREYMGENVLGEGDLRVEGNLIAIKAI
jgi:hypothetical protein